ncbi:MAG: putative PEP-binding protein, partial [Sphingomonas sp.]
LRYDWLSPAILRFLKRVSDQAQAAGVQVAVCGEMGGRPLEAMALIGLGIDRLSITPAAVGPIKAMVRSLDRAALTAHMDEALKTAPRDLRVTLTAWAADHGVELA